MPKYLCYESGVRFVWGLPIRRGILGRGRDNDVLTPGEIAFNIAMECEHVRNIWPCKGAICCAAAGETVRWWSGHVLSVARRRREERCDGYL